MKYIINLIKLANRLESKYAYSSVDEAKTIEQAIASAAGQGLIKPNFPKMLKEDGLTLTFNVKDYTIDPKSMIFQNAQTNEDVTNNVPQYSGLADSIRSYLKNNSGRSLFGDKGIFSQEYGGEQLTLTYPID